MSEVINAFHPDYVKTYHPELLTSIRLESSQHANGVVYGSKAKATRESKRSKTKKPINVPPKTKSRVSLARKEFFTFSKAGMPKGMK